MAYRYAWLTPPTKPIFVLSTILALVAVFVWIGVVRISVVQSNLFETLLLAYVVLLAGNVIRGV